MQKEQQIEQIVNGYYFMTMEDADLARQEKERVVYLERHMDYRNPYNVKAIYEKAIISKTFRTSVGRDYLKKLQDYLEKSSLGDDILAIPETQRYVLPEETKTRTARSRVSSDPLRGMRKKYRKMLFANILLIAMVVAMFVITMKGETPNIINYRTAITNEYAEWEEELTERENNVREQERKLQIEQEDNSQF